MLRRFASSVFLLWWVTLPGDPLRGGESASSPRIEPLASLPQGLAEPLKDHVKPEGFRVLQDGEVLAEFWLRPELPPSEEESGELGISFGYMPRGVFMGVVHFPNGWTDYRENDVEPGLYTLRYGVQPANGDHMGVSVYRDFLLLASAEKDSLPEKVYSDEEELQELSQSASQKVHPAVLALFPIYDDVESPEVILNEVEQWTLTLEVGGEILGLVLIGHGEI